MVYFSRVIFMRDVKKTQEKAREKASEKTNVMRLLALNGVEYKSYCYASTGAISGSDVARALKQDPDRVFKTLVTVGASGANYVFMIPVDAVLNLKRAANAVNEKSIEMLASKQLLPLTGYIHGGCSPIGMKKPFPTIIDETAQLFDTILYSAGKIGYQVETTLEGLKRLIPFELKDIADI